MDQYRHRHSFNINKTHIEKKTAIVVVITLAAMIGEIIFGILTNSMALFADGLHMGTHAFALGVSLFAYIAARKNAANEKYTFGTWKIEILGAYSSALILGLVALVMVYSSVERIIHPVTIHYNEALIVCIIGLCINIICALILNNGHSHHHHHGEDHDHDHHGHNDDLNLKSAYLHVIADALTSIFALAALLGAKFFHLNWLDPAMGIVGAVLISRWAFFLLRDSARILLDYRSHSNLDEKIKKTIECDPDTQITDLHLLKVSDNSYACIVSIITGSKLSTEDYKNRLKDFDEIAHLTVEIIQR